MKPLGRQTLGMVARIVVPYVVIAGLLVFLWEGAGERAAGLLPGEGLLQTRRGLLFVVANGLLLAAALWRVLGECGRIEADVLASEEKYRTLVETANDAIIVFDAGTGLVIDANRRAEDLLGIPREQIIGMRQLDLHPVEEHDRCRKVFKDAVEKGNMIVGTACLSHRQGRRVPVEVSVSTVEIRGRKIVQAIFRDVSERREAEERLRREKERARMYLDVAGVIIVLLDAEGKVSLINRRGAEILGATEEEIVGRDWFEGFIPPRLRGRVREVFRSLMAGETEPVEHYENPVVGRGGEERMISWHNTLIRDDEGEVVASLSSGEDITERKAVEEKARARLEHLSTLHAIDMVISSSLDLDVTLSRLLSLVIAQFRVDAAAVLLVNRHTQTLEYAAGEGFRSPAIKRSVLRVGEGAAGIAALEGHRVSIADVRAPGSGFVRAQLLEEEGVVAYHAAPLKAKGRVQGVLEIMHRAPLELDEEQQEYLQALAAQAAIAIDTAALFNDLQRSHVELTLAYDATLEGWARALELRDGVTERHTERVAELTVRLARAMGMGDEEIVHARRGALLHDIGKIGIPDSILMKPGPLTAAETVTMRRHPQYAFDLLRHIAYLKPALDVPYCHHESWDGTGYPRGLKGEQIPLAARIFALADVWDAIRASDRPYRSAMSEEQSCEKIRALSGTRLDPKVVEAFLALDQGYCDGDGGGGGEAAGA